MSLSVSLKNPRAFGREFRVLMVSGILAGVIASVLGAAVGTITPLLTVLTFGSILGLVANFSSVKSATPMLRLVLAILGGVIWVFLIRFHWAIGAGVAGLLFGGAFSLNDADSLSDKIIGWIIFSVALMLAVFTTNGLFSSLTDIVQNVLSSATWGLFLAVAAGLKRLEWIRNETISSFRESYSEASGEERDSLRSGRVLYEQILAELNRLDEATGKRAKDIADETSRALIAFARRAAELQLAEERTEGRNLEARVFELDQKILKTKDLIVRKELKAVLKEIVEQLRVRRRFGTAKAKLDARVQRCFTALERLHLSLVQMGSGDADVLLDESLSSIEQLAEELRWRNLSVDELIGEEKSVQTCELVMDSIIEEIREKW